MPEYVDFYGGPFSNFAPSPISTQHPWAEHIVLYPTVENYYQAWKATNRLDHDRIAFEPDTWKCKRIGNRILLRPDWDEIKYAVMLNGLRLKYQIPEYRDELLATGRAIIREDSPTDFIWGYRSADGTNSGQNLLGRALMQIRDELRGCVPLLPSW